MKLVKWMCDTEDTFDEGIATAERDFDAEVATLDRAGYLEGSESALEQAMQDACA